MMAAIDDKMAQMATKGDFTRAENAIKLTREYCLIQLTEALTKETG